MDLLMNLLALLVPGGIGLAVGRTFRPQARLFRIVFHCKTCDATFPCEFKNYTADEIVKIDPAGLAVADGWQREPGNRWSCPAHAREAR